MRRTKFRNALVYITVAVLCIFAGLLLGFLILLISGEEAVSAYEEFFRFSVGDLDSLSDGIKNGSSLILTGLAVGVALKSGLFNIGVNGQLIIGAITVAYFGYILNLPSVLQVLLLIVLGGVAGGIYGAIAGILKVWRGVHEVISTIMLNWIALLLVEQWIVSERFSAAKLFGGTEVGTPTIKDNSKLGSVVTNIFGGFDLSWMFVIGLVFAIMIFIIMDYTRRGYEIKAVGLNKEAARSAGINVGGRLVEAMFISGFLGGVAGAILIMGELGRYPAVAHFTQGFDGIVVALIAMCNPIGIIFVGSFLGILGQGAGALQTVGIAKSFYDLIFSIIMLTLSIQPVSRRWLEKIIDKIIGKKFVEEKE